MVTAWRMNDWSAIRNLFKKHLKYSMIQFFVTMIATVLFDLVVAILVGIVASMLIFVLKSCDLKIAISDVKRKNSDGSGKVRTDAKVVYLTGSVLWYSGPVDPCIGRIECRYAGRDFLGVWSFLILTTAQSRID